jgi:sugar O-acyltransferase, sialic acid O-acetyltransferase NeuD family/sugar O-acyltransferase, sialic acid O-acetyltransferase NeuD family
MKKILIFGAGGFGREVQWLIERINRMKPIWKIEGYLDDGIESGTEINGYKVLGGVEKLQEFDASVSVVCAVGSARIREKIISRIKQIGKFQFPNLIDPDVQMSQFISMGEGNIICAGNILTVNITLGDFVILNLSCTIGHDAVLESFVTVYPGVNISGCTKMEQGVELGTGSKIIQGITVAKNTIVGAGAVVVRHMPSECVVMGVPAKPSKFGGGGYRKLLIVGNSGHGRVIKDLARQLVFYQEIKFLDDNKKVQQENPSVLGGSNEAIHYKDEYDMIIGIGNVGIRRRLQEKYETEGISMVSLIHPHAQLPEESIMIGAGSVIMANSVIQTGTVLGKGVIINTNASIDHECKIGDYVHIAVGARLAGNVEIGNDTWIGAGAVISNNICICEKVVVGAGAVVVRNITQSGTYVGIPARKID